MTNLKAPLIDDPQSHAASVSADDALKLGLPVQKADPAGDQWQSIWRLWAKYAALGALEPPGVTRIYEGQAASHTVLPGGD